MTPQGSHPSPEPSDSGMPIGQERLLNAYGRSLRRYLAAEKALAAAPEPITLELAYEHDEAAEHFRVVRGIFRASVVRSDALRAVEGEAGDA